MAHGLRWGASVVAFAQAVLAGCGAGSAAGEPERAELVARRGVLEAVQLLSGELAAERSAQLAVPPTRIWNLQLRWIEQDGASVAAGARVAELDAGELAQQLVTKRTARLEARDELDRIEAEQRGRLAEAELALARAEAELERARLDAEVPAELVSAREAAERALALERARAGLDKARRDLESRQVTADSEIGVRRLALERAEADLAVAERTLERLELRAPAAGVFVVADHPWEGRKLQPGDGLWPGLSLGSLPDLGSLYVEALLSDVDEGRVAPGMPARCHLEAFAGEVVGGRVREVAPMAREIDRRSQRRAFRVLVDLERVDPERMRPGMSVRVEVITARVEEALLLPLVSLDRSATPARVATPRGPAEVELGPCDAHRCVALGGVSEGEPLVSWPTGEAR